MLRPKWQQQLVNAAAIFDVQLALQAGEWSHQGLQVANRHLLPTYTG
jgi:hypothetical protein